MSLRRLLALMTATLLAAGLLGASPASASRDQSPAAGSTPSPAARVDAGNDFPHLPRHCASRKDLIPLHPVKCKLTRIVKSRPTIVLWGDSHAWQLVPALREAVRGQGVNLVAFMYGSCPVMVNSLTKKQRRDADDCLKSNAMALDYVKHLRKNKRDVRVVLATFWRRYLQAIEDRTFGSYYGQMAKIFEKSGPRAFRVLGRMKVGVDVVDQAVTVPEHVRKCRKGNDPYVCNLPRHRAIREEKGTRAWVRKQARSLRDPSFVDINRMCTRKTCYGTIRRADGRINTFFDVYHITASMSRHLSYVFAPTVQRVLPAVEPDGSEGPGGDGDGSDCPLLILCR